MALLVLSLASTALASHPHARTFYLLPIDAGESNETPGDQAAGPTNGLYLERPNGAPFSARTPLLEAPLAIARTGSFHIHLADRAALTQGEATTRVEITLRDATDQAVPGAVVGSPFFLVQAETVARTDGAEGWRDLVFDLRDAALPEGAIARGFVLTQDALIIPAGHRLALTVGLVEKPATTLAGGAVSQQRNAAADTLQATGIVPQGGNCTGGIVCAFQRSLDLDATLLGPRSPLRDDTNLRNLDALMAAPGMPASTFRADDAGSWLRVATG